MVNIHLIVFSPLFLGLCNRCNLWIVRLVLLQRHHPLGNLALFLIC